VSAALVAYIASAFFFVLYERWIAHPGRRAGHAARVGVFLLALGAALEVLAFIRDGQAGIMPFSTPQSSLGGLALGWTIIGILFIVVLRVPLLGVVVSALSVIMLALVSTAPAVAPVHRPVDDKLLTGLGVVVHAFLGYAGYASFFAAALGAGLFLLQDRELRLKRLGPLSDSLPPLQRSTDIIRIGLKSGLYLMGAAIIAAACFLRGTVAPARLARDPNIVALVSILCYTAALFALGRHYGWSRHRVVILAFLLGFIVIAIHAFFIFGGSLVGSSFHSFAGA
jgi:HemX protein